MPDWSDLGLHQQGLIAQYLVEPNGSKATIKAGYSSRTAREQAAENLAKPYIASALAEARQLRAERVQIEADDVLKQVARMVFVDVRRLVDDQSRPIPLHLLPDDVAAAIQAVEIIDLPSGRTVRYRLADRVAAADRLMRHLGLFERDHRQGADAIAEMLAAVHGAGSRLPIAPPSDARRICHLPNSQRAGGS